MVRAAVVGLLLACAACGQTADPAPDESVKAEMNAIDTRLRELEAKDDIQDGRLDGFDQVAGEQAAAAPAQGAAATLVGNSANGSPINVSYSSLARCQAARSAMLAEAERACERHRQPESGPVPVYVNCGEPQLTCSAK